MGCTRGHKGLTALSRDSHITNPKNWKTKDKRFLVISKYSLNSLNKEDHNYNKSN